MALTHKVGVVYSSDAGTIANTTNSYTADGEVNFDGTIAPSTTNQLITIAFTKANVKSMVMYAAGANLTIKTNSSGTPQDTIVLTAGNQLVWTIDHLEAIPFVGNVTAMYATNASSTATVTLKMRFLVTI